MTTLVESLVGSGPVAAKDAQCTNIVLHLGGALRGLSLAQKMSSKLCSADAELLGNATHELRDWHGEVQWMPDRPLQRALATASDKHTKDCNELCVNMVRLDGNIGTAVERMIEGHFATADLCLSKIYEETLLVVKLLRRFVDAVKNDAVVAPVGGAEEAL